MYDIYNQLQIERKRMLIKIICCICVVTILIMTFWFKRKIRYKKANELFQRRRREYAAAVERAGVRIRQMMDASAPLACEINAKAAETDSGKTERPKNIRKVCGYFGGHTEFITNGK